MHDDSTHLSDRDRRLDEIVTAYLKALEAGQRPDSREWLARYPEFAGELSGFFAGQQQVAALAGKDTIGHEESPPPTMPRTLRYFGDYELLEEIARGGMGIVYKARQVSLQRHVAVKMILRRELATPAEVQ